MSQVPAKNLKYVDRGLGNELFMDKSGTNRARVIKVVPIEEALEDSAKFRENFQSNIKTKDDL